MTTTTALAKAAVFSGDHPYSGEGPTPFVAATASWKAQDERTLPPQAGYVCIEWPPVLHHRKRLPFWRLVIDIEGHGHEGANCTASSFGAHELSRYLPTLQHELEELGLPVHRSRQFARMALGVARCQDKQRTNLLSTSPN